MRRSYQRLLVLTVLCVLSVLLIAAKQLPLTVNLQKKGAQTLLIFNQSPDQVTLLEGNRTLAKLPGAGKMTFDVTRELSRLKGTVLTVQATRGAQQVKRSFPVSSAVQKLAVPTASPSGVQAVVPQSSPDPQDLRIQVGALPPDEPRTTSAQPPTGSRQPAGTKLTPPPRPSGAPGMPMQAATSALPAPPRINSVIPATVRPGSEITVHGSLFGGTGEASLYFEGGTYRPDVVSWSDARVQLRIPTIPAGVLGETDRPGRLSLRADHGGATASLRVGPDPATLVPVIQRLSADQIRSAQTLVVSGENFLQASEGRVLLHCPGMTPALRLDIVNWSDRAVGVRLPAGEALAGRSRLCDIEIINHRSLKDRSPVHLVTAIIQETWRIHKTIPVRVSNDSPFWDPIHGPSFEIPAGDLINGWRVVEATYSVEPSHGIRVYWLHKPLRGATNVLSRVSWEPADRYSGGSRELTLGVTIEGPEGLPHFAR